MIPITDVLSVPNPERTKVKFNIRDGDRGVAAVDLLFAEDPEAWLNMTRYRKAGTATNSLDGYDYVLAFAQYPLYGPQYHIFGGFFQVTKTVPEVDGGYGYELTPLELHSEYIKRLIVKLQEPVGQSYARKYVSLQSGSLNPEVYELSASTKLGSFSGYQHVRLSHRDLQMIVANDEPVWKEALSSVKGVYVITDLSTGGLYVGSAYGEARGLWQRWSNYADVKKLSGGNLELERLKNEIGPDHLIDNFQYAILEIFDMKTRDETIILREAFWKKVLDSKYPHGLNRN